MGRHDKSGITRKTAYRPLIHCLLTTFPPQPILLHAGFRQSSSQDHDLCLEIGRQRSSVGAAGSVRPFAYRNDELGDRLRRVLMHVPTAQPQFGSCGSGWGAAVLPSGPYYPVKPERGWVMQPLWKASSRFISFRLPAFWRFPPRSLGAARPSSCLLGLRCS
jgi:hypothetical protein